MERVGRQRRNILIRCQPDQLSARFINEEHATVSGGEPHEIRRGLEGRGKRGLQCIRVERTGLHGRH